jgi:hypothetical protein
MFMKESIILSLADADDFAIDFERNYKGARARAKEAGIDETKS